MAATPWITLEDYQERFAVEDPDNRDTGRILRACAAACAIIERKVERRVLESSFVRRFSGTGAAYLPLPFPPIVDIQSVNVDGVERVLGDADDAATSSSVIFHDDSRLLCHDGFPKGKALNVRVEWSAGYLASALPADLVSATLTVAGIVMRETFRVGDEGKSAGKGGSSQYLRALKGAEKDAVDALIDWRALAYDLGVPLPGDAGSELGVFELGAAQLG